MTRTASRYERAANALEARDLQQELEHAYTMARLYPGLGWGKVVKRINREIMEAAQAEAA